MEKKFLSACSMVNQDKQKEFEQELLRFRKSAEQCWENRNKVLPRIMENFEAYKDKYRITILAPIMLPPECFQGSWRTSRRLELLHDPWKDKYRITILAPIMLPPDYYHGFVERNPITGALVLAGVEKQFDFWFVDLFDRDFCCDNPENLEKDPFLFKATVLPMRTWMMQMLVQQLEAARQGYSSVLAVTFSDDKVVHSTVRDDCAAIALSQAVQLGHNYNSPFQALMYITFVCAFSKSLGLIIYTCMMSCFSLWVAQAFSVPVLFRFTRVVDLLLRSIYLILLFTAVAEVGLSSLGDALGILAILAVFCMMIFDMLRGDLGTFMTYSTETKYDILKQLGDRAWICQLVPARQKRDGKNGGTGRNGSQSSMMSKTMKAGMSFLESDAGDRPLPNLITGELPSDVTEEQVARVCVSVIKSTTKKRPPELQRQINQWNNTREALLVVDVNGMLCQLTPVDARTVDYVENVLRAIEGRPEKHSDISMYKRTYRRNPAAFAVVDDRPPIEELDATAAIQRHMEEAKMKRSQTKEMSHDGEHHAGPPTASPSSSSAASSAQKRAIEDLDFEFSGPDDDDISSPSSSSRPKARVTPVSKFSLEPHAAEEAEGTGPSSTFTAPQAMTRAMPSSSSSSAEVHAAEIGGSSSSSSSSSRKILPEDPGEDSYSEESEDYDDNDVDSGAEVGDDFVAAENKLFEGTHQAASPASAKKGGKPKRAPGAVPKRKKKGVYGDGTLPDVTLCGLLHEIQAEEDAAPVSNSLKSLDDGTSMWRVAAKKRKMATLAPPYEPMMVSIVNMPIYNRNYPSQVHKETLFRLQSKARKSAEPPAE